MSTIHGATTTIDELTALLRATPQGCLDRDDVDRLEALVRRLHRDEQQWVSPADAKDILGVTHDGTVPYLIRHGHLRHRTTADGHPQVRLVDVLYERLVREVLAAFGGDELTEEELGILKETRPGTNPWEREETTPSQ
jgi:hypothetical protein